MFNGECGFLPESVCSSVHGSGMITLGCKNPVRLCDLMMDFGVVECRGGDTLTAVTAGGNVLLSSPRF